MLGFFEAVGAKASAKPRAQILTSLFSHPGP